MIYTNLTLLKQSKIGVASIKLLQTILRNICFRTSLEEVLHPQLSYISLEQLWYIMHA